MAKLHSMDKLFVSNIEDKEILHKCYADTEILRDIPPKAITDENNACTASIKSQTQI